MIESFELLKAELPWVLGAFVFLFGACWGSFANVVIYRTPLGKSVVNPPSHCFSCGKRLAWRDNLPVLGWVLLRGRARCCGAPFSPRYALVEALMGLLFVMAWWTLPLPVAVAGWLFIFLLVVGTFIDWDTMELPDFVTVGGAAAGIIVSFLVPGLHLTPSTLATSLLPQVESGVWSMLGAAFGSGMLLWIALFAEKLLRKEAMGFGDVVLMGAIGAFCGWQGAVFAIFGGSVIGGFAIGTLMVINQLTGWELTPGKVEKATPLNPPPPTAQAPAKPADLDGRTAGATSERATPPPASIPEAPLSAEAPDPLDAPEVPPMATSENPLETAPTATPSEAPPEEKPALGVGMAIPFGPWLAAGALVYFLVLRGPVDRALNQVAAILLGHDF